MTPKAERFPVGLTLAVAVAFAVLVSLGVWQLHRFQWKQAQLAELGARQGAPAQPIAPVLARAARGQDVSFTRVVADCGPGSATTGFRMSIDASDWVARPQAACALIATPYDGIMVDRGLLQSSRGLTALPTNVILPAPTHIEGILRALPRGLPPGPLSRPAGYLLVVERETPPLPGVSPTPDRGQAADNLQYVGAYAPTWFGLAAVLACVYAAMLFRRRRPKA